MPTNVVKFPAGQRQEVVTSVNDRQNAMPASDRALTQAVLLELLGTEPISINRIYVSIAGGVLPALWLSNAMKRACAASATDGKDFRFAMSARECEEETGITRAQQITCRRRLIELGLLTEESRPHRLSRYRLHLDELRRQTLEQIRPLAASIERMQRSA